MPPLIPCVIPKMGAEDNVAIPPRPKAAISCGKRGLVLRRVF